LKWYGIEQWKEKHWFLPSTYQPEVSTADKHQESSFRAETSLSPPRQFKNTKR
jgi:hypothetical protein